MSPALESAMANSIGDFFMSGEKTVTNAGTAEALADSKVVKSLVIIAKLGNAGQVYVGASDVDNATNDGLDAGHVLAIEANGLNVENVFLDVDDDGDGVDFYAVVF